MVAKKKAVKKPVPQLGRPNPFAAPAGGPPPGAGQVPPFKKGGKPKLKSAKRKK